MLSVTAPSGLSPDTLRVTDFDLNKPRFSSRDPKVFCGLKVLELCCSPALPGQGSGNSPLGYGNGLEQEGGFSIRGKEMD